jgi:hypothetical protein
MPWKMFSVSSENMSVPPDQEREFVTGLDDTCKRGHFRRMLKHGITSSTAMIDY